MPDVTKKKEAASRLSDALFSAKRSTAKKAVKRSDVVEEKPTPPAPQQVEETRVEEPMAASSDEPQRVAEAAPPERSSTAKAERPPVKRPAFRKETPRAGEPPRVVESPQAGGAAEERGWTPQRGSPPTQPYLPGFGPDDVRGGVRSPVAGEPWPTQPRLPGLEAVGRETAFQPPLPGFGVQYSLPGFGTPNRPFPVSPEVQEVAKAAENLAKASPRGFAAFWSALPPYLKVGIIAAAAVGGITALLNLLRIDPPTARQIAEMSGGEPIMTPPQPPVPTREVREYPIAISSPSAERRPPPPTSERERQPLPPATFEESPSVPLRGFYTVKPGDTLWDIAQRNGLTIEQLLAANPKFTSGGRKPQLIYPGETVAIPEPWPVLVPGTEMRDGLKVYKVRQGDTLWEIAQRTGTTVDEIVQLNPFLTQRGRTPDIIYPGEIVVLPDRAKDVGWDLQPSPWGESGRTPSKKVGVGQDYSPGSTSSLGYSVDQYGDIVTASGDVVATSHDISTGAVDPSAYGFSSGGGGGSMVAASSGSPHPAVDSPAPTRTSQAPPAPPPPERVTFQTPTGSFETTREALASRPDWAFAAMGLPVSSSGRFEATTPTGQTVGVPLERVATMTPTEARAYGFPITFGGGGGGGETTQRQQPQQPQTTQPQQPQQKYTARIQIAPAQAAELDLEKYIGDLEFSVGDLLRRYRELTSGTFGQRAVETARTAFGRYGWLAPMAGIDVNAMFSRTLPQSAEVERQRRLVDQAKQEALRALEEAKNVPREVVGEGSTPEEANRKAQEAMRVAVAPYEQARLKVQRYRAELQALQRLLEAETERLTRGTYEEQQRLGRLVSAVEGNPWLQQLGSPPPSVVGGRLSEYLSGGVRTPISWQQFVNLSPWERAALRTRVEAEGTSWGDYLRELRRSMPAGWTPPMPSRLEAVTSSPQNILGYQQLAEAYGWAPGQYEAELRRRFSSDVAPTVALRV